MKPESHLKNIPPESDASPEARGARLRRLRNLANLSRKELCERYDIKLDTLIGWEVARHGGLSENGAGKIITCLAKEGVQASFEWLFYDIGSSPNLLKDFDKLKSDLEEKSDPKISETNEEIFISEELFLFQKHYRDTIDYIVDDESMHPQYTIGDRVAGIKQYKKKIKQLVGKDCIVKLTNGVTFLCHIQKISHNNHYTLLSTNPKITAAPLLITEAEIVCAAAVIWLRRKHSKI